MRQCWHVVDALGCFGPRQREFERLCKEELEAVTQLAIHDEVSRGATNLLQDDERLLLKYLCVRCHQHHVQFTHSQSMRAA